MDFPSKSTTPYHNYIKSFIDNTQISEIPNEFQNHVNHRITQDRETFLISNKFVTNIEWDSIVKLLETSKNFATLSIIGINIESHGLKRLTDIINTNDKIRTFKLEWNYLNEYPDEFEILCQAISKNNHLQFLHFNNNKITNPLTDFISKIIQSNSTLLQIDLRWNEITNEGAKKICDALNKNFTLQELILSGNKISEDIILDINEKLKRNKIFQKKSNDSEFSETNPKSNRSTWKASKHTDRSYLKMSIPDPKNTPVNKEIELLNEYKARYESQLLNNSIIESKLKETEIFLTNEKSQFEDFKKRVEKEIQNERDILKECQEQFLKKNEEFVLKEIELRKFINDFEIKISLLTQEKIDVCNENLLLKEQIKQMKEIYEEKYKLLEKQFTENNGFHKTNYDKLKFDYEKLKRDCGSEIKRINTEWERKIKLKDEQLKIFENEKEELEKTNFILKKELSEKRIILEIENRDKEFKFIEESNRKIENLIKNYELKFSTLLASNQDLKIKISNLIQEISDLRKNHTEEKLKLERTIDILTLDKSNLTKNQNELNLNVNRLGSEISLKDDLIDKLKKDLNDINSVIKQYELKNQTIIEEISTEYMKDRHHWEKERREIFGEKSNLENLILEMKMQIEKLELNKQKFLENLSKDINTTIEERFKHKYQI